MKIAILARPNRKNGAERLMKAAISRGHKAEIIDYTECYCNIQKNKPEIFYRGELLARFDAIIPRIAIESQWLSANLK
jgi:ribosomal protein S6--L-glutamate ligase